MKSRHTLTRLVVALSLVLLLPPHPIVAADEPGTLPFLKVGSSYDVIYVGDTVRATVKILEPAGAQWFRVEVLPTRKLVVSREGGAPGAAVEKPHERWINFANVRSVAEAVEPAKK